MVHDIDREITDGLTCEELSELVIGYAQENERLSAENERLQQQVRGLIKTSADHLQYIRSVRDAEVAVKRFVSDPAISPYLPDMDTVITRLFGEPKPYGGVLHSKFTPEQCREWLAKYGHLLDDCTIYPDSGYIMRGGDDSGQD